MQFDAKFRVLWPLAFVCFLTGFAGRPAHSAPSDYPHAYETLMEDYAARMRYLTTRPLPPNSAPKEQKRAAVAAQTEEIARAYAGFAMRLAALKPPAELREVHAATLSWLWGDAQDNHKWAESLRRDNRRMRALVLQETERHELQAIVKIQQALQHAGQRSPEIQTLINELRQNIKTP